MNFIKEWKEIPRASRPKMRWWLPATLSEEAELIHEIRMMKEAGFVGAEIAPSKIFHPGLGRIDQGWGQKRWSELLKTMLKEAREQEFELDLMLRGSSPVALPLITDVNDPLQGVRLELDAMHIDGITKENPYNGPLPINPEAVEKASAVKGKVTLYAVTVAKYMDKEKKILSFDSARELDINSHVEKNDQEESTSYSVRFAPEDEGEYVLFVWWQHPSGDQVSGIPQHDFLGKQGTARLIEYYENTFLPSLGEDGKYFTSFFIDSLEWGTHLDFVDGFRELFLEKYGYDLTKYLPALYRQDYDGVGEDPRPDFCFDVYSEQLLQVYGEFLTDLYIENHLKPMQAFCERNGLTLRYQTSYGKYLELARTAGYVDIPETETLYGKDIIDFYRVQSGSVHITGKNRYSVEAAPEMPGRGNGDENSGNYAQGFRKFLWHLQRAYAGGANQVYFHGCRYRGQYTGPGNEKGVLPGVHWPGHEPMGFLGGWSNSWDDRQPNWKGMRQLTDALARMQYVLQQGRAQVDLAIYHHSYVKVMDSCGAKKLFDSPVLEQSGYTYDFLCPADLIREESNSIACLYPGGPEYKALVFYRQKNLPAQVVKKLLELTDRKIPVIFCEGIPHEPAFLGEESIRADIQTLLGKDNVCECAHAEQLPECLQQLQVEQEISYEGTKAVLHVHRQTEDADFFYFYHYANANVYSQLEGTETIRFCAKLKCCGKPYVLNPWTGAVRLADVMEQNENSLSLMLELAPNDSIMVLVEHPAERETDRKEEMEPEVEPKKLLLKEKAFVAENWTLTVESWTAGNSPLETSKEIIKTVKLKDPVPWTWLERLEAVSGVGYYRAELELDAGWKEGSGAILAIKNIEDCYIIKVNGVEIPANQIETKIDIGRQLKKGKNQVEITVYSTLLNAAIVYGRQHGIEPLSTRHLNGRPQYKDYGMTGPVKVIPYT